MRHITPVLTEKCVLQRLLLAPAIERRGVIQEPSKCSVGPLWLVCPEIDVGGEGSVVIPHALMPEPTCFCGNIFLRGGLEQSNVSLDDGIAFVEHRTGKDR